MNSKNITFARSLVAVTALTAATLTVAQPEPVPQSQPRSLDATTDATRELSRSDRNFLEKAAKSGMKEIEVSQAVLGRLTNQSVQQFAQMMVTDHSAANAELKTLAAQKGVALTATTDRYTE